MVSLSILYALIGAILGLRFKVLILVPATMIGIFLVVGFALAGETSVWWAMIFAIAAASSLQIGYLSGATIGLLVAASDLRAIHQASTAASPRSAH
jgi:hypothetical protein